MAKRQNVIATWEEWNMADYRIYKIKDNHIAEPPALITADADPEVIEQAKELVDGHDVEVWEGTRFVIGLRSKDK